MSEQLGELLRTFRSTALLSQETLAERSGLSTRTVSDIETGSARTPRLITVMLLAEALRLPAAERARLAEAARKPARSPKASSSATQVLLGPVLVGRDADVTRLCALLSSDGVRLVTLVGPAGVGKTSLALKIASQRACAFESGAMVAELAPIAEPSLVPVAVARAIGIRESADTTAAEAVNAHLKDRSALIVLDNLEHLTPAAAWIAALLANCPRVTILATSREPLHLRTEHVYAVRRLANAAAVQLFVARAQMVLPDFQLTQGNARAVETIVDHLEGLPLALELAAPRLLLLAPKALAARLERRLPLLGDGAVDRPERQQTMRRAIAWSYDLLSPEEQRLFRRLSVLKGGGTLEAAAAVAGAERDDDSILMRLAPLVDKNMVVLAEDAAGEPRVSMLELLREYAQERLEQGGELPDAQRRHAEYTLEFASHANGELAGAEQRLWLESFEREHENIRAALLWATRNDAAYGFGLLSVVWRFWWFRGYFREGVTWVRSFLTMRGDSPAGVPDLLCATVLRAYAVLLSVLGSHDEALAPCEEAIAIQRAHDDDAGLAGSLTSLGIVLHSRGEYDHAEEVYDESLAIATRLGDEAGVASALSGLASVAFFKENFERSAALGERSVVIYRRLGHEWGLAHALMKIGIAAYGARNYERAEEIFGECLRVQRAIGNTGSMYYSLANLGDVAHKRGRYELALARYREALDLLDSMPSKDSLAGLLESISATIRELGDPARAARLLGAADALRGAIHVPHFAPDREDYDAEVERVREALGAEGFDAQWRIGAGVALERALEEAREACKVPAAVRERSRYRTEEPSSQERRT